jgi:E3 ubiquitin-protein ligase BIG BROTHER-like protein
MVFLKKNAKDYKKEAQETEECAICLE